MVTSIQISSKLLEKLKQMKLYEKESYEEVIWDMVEDRMELSEETKKAIEDYEKRMAEGDSSGLISIEDLKKEVGLNV